MKKSQPRQASFFDDFTSELQQSEPVVPNHPTWKFATGYENIDLIEEEPVIVFMFSIDELEKVSGYYALPLLRQLMNALWSMSMLEEEPYRDATFTIFVADQFGVVVNGSTTDVFSIAVGNGNEYILGFILLYLKKVPGYCDTRADLSYRYIPTFRYDHGYIIEYSDPELAGTIYEDTVENYGTVATIYRRYWMPPEAIGRRRGHYGKLRKQRR